MKAINWLLILCFVSINQQLQAQKIQGKGIFFQIAKDQKIEFDKKFSKKETLSEEAKLKLDKEYKKYLRWLWYWENRIDAEGNFGTYNREYFKKENIFELKKFTQTQKKLNVNWTQIGPMLFPPGTDISGIKGIGRIDAIVVDPNDSNHVFVGARAGGIWETNNINANNVVWNCLTNDIPIGTVNDLEIVNNTLYASVSNMHQRMVWQGEQLYGLGVIKKDLNQDEWHISNESFESLNIAISKSDSNIIYSVGQKNIHKSIDGGDTWEKLSDPFPEINNSRLLLEHIEVNPLNSSIAVISGKIDRWISTYENDTNILVFKTIDGGKSWINLTNSIENLINDKINMSNSLDQLLDLSQLHQNNRTHAVATDNYNGTLYIGLRTFTNKLYFVTATGNWSNLELYNSLSSSNRYYFDVDHVAPIFEVVNSDEILYGGWFLRAIKNIPHTSNTIANFSQLHQDIRSIHYNSNLGRLLVGTDGSIHKAFDVSSNLSFSSYLNMSGNLNLFLAYNMAYVNISGNRVVRIGTQDTGWYENFNTGSSWTGWNRLNPFGEGMIFPDHTNSNIVYLNNKRSMEKSTNGGASVSNTGIKVGSYQSGGGEAFQVNVNNGTQIIYDKETTGGDYPLHLSNNQLTSSIDISNGVPDLMEGRNLAVEISKANSSVFYVARRKFNYRDYGINNTIYKSTNLNFNNPGIITYVNLTANINFIDNEVLNKAYINDIEVDDTNENKVWLGFGNLAEGKKVYFSSNGGDTWANISSNLPNVPVNSLQYDSVNHTLYAGTDYGVYYYNTSTGLWARYGVGFPVAIVTTIAIDNSENEIVASTHGRSVWAAPLILSPCSDRVVNTSETWTTDQEICGDLIIQNGGSITSTARIKANNIIIKDGSSLSSVGGEVISNYYNTTNGNLNTDIIVEANAELELSNCDVRNFNINVRNGANIFLQQEGVSLGYVNLNHSKINVYDNATYNHGTKVTVNLNDVKSTINFFNDFSFGTFGYATKIDSIKFSGLGSVNIIDTDNIYIQNESLISGNKYRFDSDGSITTGNNVDPNSSSTNGNFDTNNADVTLKAKHSVILDSGTIIETDSFIAIIDSEDLSDYNKTPISINNEKDSYNQTQSFTEKIIESVTIAPNPTRKYLKIQLKNETLLNGEFVIRDLTGNVLYKSTIKKSIITVDLSSFKQGVYLIHFYKGENELFKRIIKI